MTNLILLCGTETYENILYDYPVHLPSGFSFSDCQVVVSGMVPPDFIQLVPKSKHLLYEKPDMFEVKS